MLMQTACVALVLSAYVWKLSIFGGLWIEVEVTYWLAKVPIIVVLRHTLFIATFPFLGLAIYKAEGLFLQRAIYNGENSRKQKRIR